MGCFLGCFKGPEDRKRRRSPRRSPSRERWVSERCQQPIPSAKQISPNPSAPEVSPPEEAVALPEKKKEKVEKGNAGGGRKKVTFDLTIKTYEQVLADDSPDSEDDEEAEEIDEEEKPTKGEKDESYPKLGAFPSNHRYENCESSDDDHGCESGEDEFDTDFDEEEEEEEKENEEESYDSFFSLPVDKERQGLHEEVSSPELFPGKQSIPTAGGCTRDRSQFVHSVLNPVENLSQWKEIKLCAVPAKNPDKQNLGEELRPTSISESEIKVKKPQVPKQEVSVDASLSNWLPSSGNSTAETPQLSNSHLSNSSLSREEHPILGALTIGDIKQSSMISYPRRSPNKSPPADEITILGTVGRYWSCENPGNWHTTPFEVRLERALRNGAA